MALDIEIGIEHDRWREPSGPGSYEWWYFDGIDDRTGYAFVVIFFRGIPFSGARQLSTDVALSGGERDSPDRFPAVAFSLYGPERTEMYMVNLHPPSSLTIDEDRYGIEIGRNSARFDGSRYVVDIDDQQLDTRSIQVRLELEPAEVIPASSQTDDDHVWMLSAPRGRFRLHVRSGEESHELSGWGYHDHNLGESSLQSQFRRWDWGRVHLEDRTVVFYHALDRQNGVSSYLATTFSDGHVELEEARFEPVETRHNLYGLKYPSRLLIGSRRHSIEVRNNRILDNGPFYSRMLADFRVNGVESRGFTETLRPRALDWRWFRALLNTRVRPADTRDRVGRKITWWLVQKGL